MSANVATHAKDGESSSSRACPATLAGALAGRLPTSRASERGSLGAASILVLLLQDLSSEPGRANGAWAGAGRAVGVRDNAGAYAARHPGGRARERGSHYVESLRQNRQIASYPSTMTRLNTRSRLIDARQYVLRSRWQDVQPRAREQNAFLKTHAFADFAVWHLGLTEGAATRRRRATRLSMATSGGCTGWA